MIELLPDDPKKEVMKTLDVYIEKGEKKGIAKGIARGIAKGIAKGIVQGIEEGKIAVLTNIINNTEWSDSKIVDITGVSEELVKKFRYSLDEKSS